VVLGKSAAYLNVKPDFSRLYVYYCLQSEELRRQFFDGLTGSTIGNLGLGTIRNALISVPPTKVEQEAIAETLKDSDALIESLEQLLAKKCHLKLGAIQELLAGNRRLPGFNGDWEIKRIGEVFSIFAGTSKSADVANGGRYWIVDMGSVSRAGRLNVSKKTDYQGDFLKLGDLVMPKDDIGGGNIIGRVGYIDADNAYVLSDHIYCLRATIGNPLFLSYVINSYQINIALRKRVIGSAQLGLGRKSVEQQEIPFPGHKEQTAIAAILFDMDAEIDAVEAKLTKVRQIKQGMIQELLTGRIRLV
jgi:type I restriction enzyme S subunit